MCSSMQRTSSSDLTWGTVGIRYVTIAFLATIGYDTRWMVAIQPGREPGIRYFREPEIGHLSMPMVRREDDVGRVEEVWKFERIIDLLAIIVTAAGMVARLFQLIQRISALLIFLISPSCFSRLIKYPKVTSRSAIIWIGQLVNPWIQKQWTEHSDRLIKSEDNYVE